MLYLRIWKPHFSSVSSSLLSSVDIGSRGQLEGCRRKGPTSSLFAFLFLLISPWQKQLIPGSPLKPTCTFLQRGKAQVSSSTHPQRSGSQLHRALQAPPESQCPFQGSESPSPGVARLWQPQLLFIPQSCVGSSFLLLLTLWGWLISLLHSVL